MGEGDKRAAETKREKREGEKEEKNRLNLCSGKAKWKLLRLPLPATCNFLSDFFGSFCFFST